MSYVSIDMSNISQLTERNNNELGNKILTEDHEGYKLLQDNAEVAFSLCKDCLTMNFFNIEQTTFECSNCSEVQTN